jgi:hypothetical protein
VRQLSRVLLSQESTYDPTMANRAALQAVDVGRHHGFYPVEVTFSLRTEHCAFETAIRPQLAHTHLKETWNMSLLTDRLSVRLGDGSIFCQGSARTHGSRRQPDALSKAVHARIQNSPSRRQPLRESDRVSTWQIAHLPNDVLAKPSRTPRVLIRHSAD